MTVELGGGTVIDIPVDGGAIDIPISLAGLLVDLKVRAFAPDETVTGAAVAATLDAVVGIDLTVHLGAQEVADVHLGVGQMSASAKAPAGGVDCDGGPVDDDTDDDGLTDDEEENDTAPTRWTRTPTTTAPSTAKRSTPGPTRWTRTALRRVPTATPTTTV